MQKSYTLFLSNNIATIFTALIVVSMFLILPISGKSYAACISYSSSSKTITVSCTTATHLTDVNNQLKNTSILKKESTGVWLLAANLVVAKGGNFVIDSTDTSWLKIRSDGSVGYGLKNSGTLKIDSVKITSWNTAANAYASAGSSGKTPRGYIVSLGGATGTMNVLNSEISYLGYTGSGHHGLDYYSGDKSIIQNNQIHHNWRAFYSSGVGGLNFNKNVVHDNYEYGIDPHTGTHDMYITYNKSYRNNHGIICSQDCYNIHIENNEIYDNKADGIYLNSGSHHSYIKNNKIHDQDTAIQLPSISYSEISGNTITGSKYGIKLYKESGKNTINNNIHDNNIEASYTGIEVRDGASTNSLVHNTINGLGTGRGIVVKGSTTSGNIVNDNYISNARYPISLTSGNINSKFVNNHITTVASSGEYTMGSASALKLESTKFSSDIIKSVDSSSIPVSISKSGTIKVTSGSTSQNFDTNAKTYSKTLTNYGKITVSSVSSTTSATATASSAISSSTTDDEVSAMQSLSNNNSAQELAKRALEDAEKDLSNNNNNKEKSKDASQSSDNNKQSNVKPVDRNDNRKQVAPSEVPSTDQDDSPRSSSKLSSPPHDVRKFSHHDTILTLKVEDKRKHILTGTLLDKSTSRPIQGMKISFTVSDPLMKIADQTTNKEGKFETDGFAVPSQPASYRIQAHFAKSGPYDAADSNLVLLKGNAPAPSTKSFNKERTLEVQEAYNILITSPIEKSENKYINKKSIGQLR